MSKKKYKLTKSEQRTLSDAFKRANWYLEQLPPGWLNKKSKNYQKNVDLKPYPGDHE